MTGVGAGSDLSDEVIGAVGVDFRRIGTQAGHQLLDHPTLAFHSLAMDYCAVPTVLW